MPIGANQFRAISPDFFSKWHNFRSGYWNQNLLSVSLSPQSKSFRLKYNIYSSKRMPPSEYIDFGLRGCSVLKKKIGSLFHEYTVLCGRHFNDYRSITLVSSDIVNFIPPLNRCFRPQKHLLTADILERPMSQQVVLTKVISLLYRFCWRCAKGKSKSPSVSFCHVQMDCKAVLSWWGDTGKIKFPYLAPVAQQVFGNQATVLR